MKNLREITLSVSVLLFLLFMLTKPLRYTVARSWKTGYGDRDGVKTLELPLQVMDKLSYEIQNDFRRHIICYFLGEKLWILFMLVKELNFFIDYIISVTHKLVSASLPLRDSTRGLLGYSFDLSLYFSRFTSAKAPWLFLNVAAVLILST